MPLWKQILLNAYYYASYPVRWWNRCEAVSDEKVPMIVLYYHRIADDEANPWTTSNRMFARQIDWLRRRFEFISLEEAQRRIRRGLNYRPCVSITFDDGYADNCQQAIPLLIREQIPCTYFVTLHNVISGEPFSHDLIHGHAPRPNTIDEIRAMAAAGIEIGAHTYTHADLGPITDRRLLDYEVVQAGEDLQRAIGRPVRYFAFPYGQYVNLSQEAFAAADHAGYEGVCSAYGGFNAPGGDSFHLQRIAVTDTMIHLKNWVTGDPRKLFTPRFVYHREISPATQSSVLHDAALHNQ